MKVLIIEDELSESQLFKEQLLSLRPDIQVVAQITSIKQAVAFLSENTDVDIIFSDIHIDDGLSFSIFEKVDTDAMIVFTTAYDKYALKAFEYNGIDYLLKPIDSKSLERAIVKCERYVKDYSFRNINEISSDFARGEEIRYRKRLFLDRGKDIIIAKVSDICFIYTEKGDTRIYLNDGTWGAADASLLELEKSLDPDFFKRINRQCIINVDCIAGLTHNLSRGFDVLMKHPYEDRSFSITGNIKKEILNILE